VLRLGFIFCLILLAPAFAQARSSSLYAYPESRIWTSVVRLVRVDFESPIVEKDKDAGYLLFSYAHAGKQYAGSVEVVPTVDKGEQRVKVLIQIAGMPSYVERMMLDKLEKKLVQEFGAPLVTPAKSDKKKAADADADTDTDTDTDKQGSSRKQGSESDAESGAEQDDSEASGERSNAR
jgi:hypothetical protein